MSDLLPIFSMVDLQNRVGTMALKSIISTIFLFALVMGVGFLGCSDADTPSNSPNFPDNGGSNGDGIGNYDPDPDPTEQPNDTSGTKGTWDLPKNEIVPGCLGRDCIPSIQRPEFIDIESASYLQDDDLVFGLVVDGQALAFPHRILDWHEVVNYDAGGKRIAVTYCPLTGSGVAIDVNTTALEGLDAALRSFGVSGLLYNNNLIVYDRVTLSNWSQMLLRCVNGRLRGTSIVVELLLETTWRSWKQMFPDSRVLSTDTGFNRPYDVFPYGNYKTDPFLLFPITHDDRRLPRKERLHGIVADRFNLTAKTYRFQIFEPARTVNDEVNGEPVVVAGMKSADFYVSYSRVADDGTVLTFDIKTESPHIYPFDLVDNEGNVWNILGEAVSGMRKGEKLKPTDSYNAYWFAWGAFFPDVPIYRF